MATARASRRPAKPLWTSTEALPGSKIIVAANLIGRSASLRYRRLLGLPRLEWRIVALLGERPPCSLNELARRAGLDKSQISRGVASLVRRGLVRREPSRRSQREVALSLSRKGRDGYRRLIAAALVRNEELLAAFSPAERSALDRLLDRLVERAHQLLGQDQTRSRRRSAR
jgi:DNA-binding MarR family transcriptional regulator